MQNVVAASLRQGERAVLVPSTRRHPPRRASFAVATTGSKVRPTCEAFTLIELLVSVVVLVIVIFVVAQLTNSTTAVTRTGNKHIDTDTQARVVFDRMALDFAQMLKRTDIDYYVKQRSGCPGIAPVEFDLELAAGVDDMPRVAHPGPANAILNERLG